LTTPRLILVDRIDSTQDLARRHAREDCVSGTVVVAREQTAGRGRRGRVWESKAGQGLWMTYVHRTERSPRDWGAATLAAALAVCAAIERSGLAAATKWPNDVLLGGRKVAGILADTEGKALLVGIGLNVLQTPEDFPEPLRRDATSILIEGVRMAPEDVLPGLVEELDRAFVSYECSGLAPVCEGFWRRCALAGRPVDVQLPDGEPCSGVAAGLGPFGELLIENGTGIRTIVSGTVRLRESS
jgi:BirA family biotin operon repressor/biotin-[acetyl-CoA-carboxylase] ligase